MALLLSVEASAFPGGMSTQLGSSIGNITDIYSPKLTVFHIPVDYSV